MLHAGTNFVAVEVRQNDGQRSELWFELGLTIAGSAPGRANGRRSRSEGPDQRGDEGHRYGSGRCEELLQVLLAHEYRLQREHRPRRAPQRAGARHHGPEDLLRNRKHDQGRRKG
jgi:hypothetical protein